MKFLSSFVVWSRRLATALGGLVLVATFTPLVFWWATALAGPWDDPKGDVVIVLSGAGMEGGIIGLNSYWRTVYAMRLYQAGEFREILISGGGEEIPIAQTMRAFMLASGVPEAAVRVETASKNTVESANNVAKMVQAEPEHYRNRRLVLLTSDYHMYRSYRVFRAAGVQVEPRPIPDIRKRYGTWPNRWSLLLELLQETAKIGYYKAHGWI